ncbi:hypothetical protein SAMN05216276_1008178 [Streptosporangium subroseum]|uniref:Uncharacterized protein n=2 Tax=Streptosporangium subroseum TaxID=106412 RepID=A0A239E3V3_9ACTN|nr:hypothetical protein SAMN05216276_1008178 [Streptosporangium subroseum]
MRRMAPASWQEDLEIWNYREPPPVERKLPKEVKVFGWVVLWLLLASMIYGMLGGPGSSWMLTDWA